MSNFKNDISSNIAALTAKDWAELAEIYEQVKSYKGKFSVYTGEEVEPDGTITLGYIESPPVVHQTMQFFYDKKLIVAFDWSGWDEGRAMFRRKGDDKFDDISAEDVLKLFTAVVRNDRFSEGAFANIFDAGDAQLLLKRLLDFRPAE